MKDTTDQFDRQREAMRRAMAEVPEDHRYVMLTPKPRDRFLDALWWIGFAICVGILIYGSLKL